MTTPLLFFVMASKPFFVKFLNYIKTFYYDGTIFINFMIMVLYGTIEGYSINYPLAFE